MKVKLDQFGLGLILCPVTPLLGLLTAWWGSYAWLPERWIPGVTLGGLLTGILVDVLLLKRWIGWAERMNPLTWIAIYLFYSMGAFGFFMGVPVFNAALALPAGFVIGRQLAAGRASPFEVRRAARRTALFTTSILGLICLASAVIALVSTSTASDLRGMLHLPFEVTHGMILALILVGGTGLMTASWLLSVASVHLTYRLLQKPALSASI